MFTPCLLLAALLTNCADVANCIFARQTGSHFDLTGQVLVIDNNNDPVLNITDATGNTRVMGVRHVVRPCRSSLATRFTSPASWAYRSTDPWICRAPSARQSASSKPAHSNRPKKSRRPTSFPDATTAGSCGSSAESGASSEMKSTLYAYMCSSSPTAPSSISRQRYGPTIR